MGLGKRFPSTSLICLAKDDHGTCVQNICGQNCGTKAGPYRRTHLASTSTPWKKSAFIPGMSSQELRGHFGSNQAGLASGRAGHWEDMH